MQSIINFKDFKFTCFRFRWDDEMDSDLVKEMLNSNIFSYKYNSKSRGAQWKLLAERLNEYWGEGFQTNERALRDKYNGLKKKFKNKMRYEEAASGIAPPDLTELERGLEELIEKEEQDKNEDKIKSEKDEALSARDRCMKGMTPKRYFKHVVLQMHDNHDHINSNYYRTTFYIFLYNQHFFVK